MSLIGNLISEIEVGAIDLDRCLSTYHELSDDDKFLLALADRKSRFKRGEGYTIESYLQRLPWVADKPSLLQQMILDEFGFRLGSVDSAKLADELCSQHPGLGADLESQVRERLDQWNATLLSKAEFDALCDRFEEAVTEKQSPVIEDWLRLAPVASRVDLLRELLLIESYHITESGYQPDWVQYHTRFPEYFELIEEVRVHQDEALRSRSRIDGATSNGENAVAPLYFSAPFSRHRNTADSNIEQKQNYRHQGMAFSTVELPESFGRYRVCSVLGKGGFGVVYHARDTQLERDVAIKVIQEASLGVSIRQSFLTEAQIVAALDHPNIVPVYDVGQNDDGDFFVVSKLIDGSDLSKRIKLNRPDRLLALRIVEQIAETLNYSHAKGLVHRDVKPGNILLDRQDRPYLADFGLAIRETEERKQGDPLGTPAYMSPEQARGDGKRVDHRSDIYSLGVVLYELLTGRRPFFSDNLLNLIRLVATEDVRSPRVFDGTIPQELERVCLKALARHASERYTVAGDFAEDIRWVISQPSLIPANLPSGALPSGELATQSPSTPRTGPTRVVPKGLRSFEAADADFFLELLPGPFDRDGLPESLRFWKTRIEETEPEHTFKVGVMYGPSGCGKSSLMKAGLLPRLSTKITAIYVEASGDDTEARLLRVIRRRVPDAEGESLKEILSVIRRRKLVPTGGKLLIVIDQFEQWLFAEKDYAKSSLTDALFQCDGGTIQAVVLVREEFWSSVSRFFRELDIPLADCENSALVDLFDLEHATNVLGLFGRAFEKIPDSRKDWSEDQREFINKSIEGLSEDRKVIPVRIAVFADMMRSRPWTTAALREIGGTEGVGFTFLEEMFGSKHAPIQHRQHQEAVRGVLSALLPDVGTDIKGAMQSADALQTAAGYERKPREFQELLGILDKNLRLITPVDEFVDDGGDNSETAESRIQSRSYQLAHDYLVPSLRSWLTQKQRETKQGRAELKLAERAAAWSINKESKQLPTFVECLQIFGRTDASKWKANEKAVMQQASRYHLQRFSVLSVAGVLLALGGWFAWHETAKRQELTRISGFVNTLVNADPSAIPDIVTSLGSNPEIADECLAHHLVSEGKTPAEQKARLHAQLAKLPRDPSLVEPLVEELLAGKVTYVLSIRQLLRPSGNRIIGSLRNLLNDDKADPERRFRAALALADYVPSPDDPIWNESNRQLIVRHLVSSNPDHQPMLREALRPIQGQLLSGLEAIFGDAAASDVQRLNAANAFADFAANDVAKLSELLTVATPPQFTVLYPLVATGRSAATVEELGKVAATLPADELGFVKRVPFGERRANAAVTLLRLAASEKVLPVFEMTDDPEALTQFIFRCKERGLGIEPLLDLLERVSRMDRDGISLAPAIPKQTQSIASVSTWEQAKARYALLLAIGEYSPNEIPVARRELLIRQLANWYETDPSSGVHGASGWLLRQLGESDIVTRVDQTPVPYSTEREWFTLAVTVTPKSLPAPPPLMAFLPPRTFYYTFVVFPAGDYEIGSFADEPDRKKDESRNFISMTRPIAVLDREVTGEELIAFSPAHAAAYERNDVKLTGSAVFASWYDSVSYCRWLGKEMGLSESDQCYADPETLNKEQYDRDPEETWAPKDWPLDISRRGFRLPTESEWEVVARSGSRTAYGFGSDVALLDRFGWFINNSGNRVHTARELPPSVRGLFDLHGNVLEWTHDWYEFDRESSQSDPLGAEKGLFRVYRGGGWFSRPLYCRSASRSGNVPSTRGDNIGFRLLLSPSTD